MHWLLAEREISHRMPCVSRLTRFVSAELFLVLRVSLVTLGPASGILISVFSLGLRIYPTPLPLPMLFLLLFLDHREGRWRVGWLTFIGGAAAMC
jgi:hypothetical protein